MRLEQQLAARTPPRAAATSTTGTAAARTLSRVAASDDGVQTRLTFAAEQELPAVFVRNEDGSESLLNFSVVAGDVIMHRVAAVSSSGAGIYWLHRQPGLLRRRSA